MDSVVEKQSKIKNLEGYRGIICWVDKIICFDKLLFFNKFEGFQRTIIKTLR